MLNDARCTTEIDPGAERLAEALWMGMRERYRDDFDDPDDWSELQEWERAYFRDLVEIIVERRDLTLSVLGGPASSPVTTE